MNAYLIDPERRSITEVEVGDGADISSHIGCSMFCIGTYLPDGDAVFVDDEGLLYEDRLTHFFRIDDRVIESTNPQILAGKGLVLGGNRYNGESEDVRISLEKLSEAVRWVGVGKTKCNVDGIEVDILFGAAEDEL